MKLRRLSTNCSAACLTKSVVQASSDISVVFLSVVDSKLSALHISSLFDICSLLKSFKAPE